MAPGGDIQNLPNRFAFHHDDFRRNTVAVAQQFRLAFQRRAQRLFIGRLFRDSQKRGGGMARARQQSTQFHRLVRRVGAIAANQDAHNELNLVSGD